MDIYFKGVFPSEQEYALTSWKMLDNDLSWEWKGYSAMSERTWCPDSF